MNPLLVTAPPASTTSSARTRNRLWIGVAVGLIIFGLSMICIGGIALMLRAFRTNPIAPPRIGAKMSDLPLLALDGKKSNLSDYAGRPILVNVWATWCPPCRAEMPYIESYYLNHQDEGLVVLAISTGEDYETVADFVKESGLTLPVFLDENEEISNGMNIDSYPTSIIIGRDGNVKRIHVGMFTPDALEEEITPYLK